MSIGQNAIGADFDLAEDTAKFAVGTHMKGAAGKEYVYVQANGALAAGDVAQLDETYQATPITLTTSAAAIGDLVGVAEGAFTDNQYGWVQIKGACSVSVNTGAAANTKLNTTATGGELDDDATSGAETILGLVTTAAESGGLAAGMLNYPMIDATL